MAREVRPIDANAIDWHESTECFGHGWFETVKKVYAEDIAAMPTLNVVEVVHGRWVSDQADILFHCSECETQISTDWDYDDLIWNYCPNCGAKMDVKECHV